jgi:response regulator RpfG family c-di-GMP phosphodiesterase
MEKILLSYIIDDDEIILYLSEKLIKKHAFCENLEKFNDAKSALQRLKFALEVGENLPNVILFDLNMPKMNGWEFVSKLDELLNAFNVNIPSFIFTSSIDKVDEEKAANYSRISGFIQKPLSLVKLNKILRLMNKNELIVPKEYKYYQLPAAI